MLYPQNKCSAQSGSSANMLMVVLDSNPFTSHYTLGIYMLSLCEFQSAPNYSVTLSACHVLCRRCIGTIIEDSDSLYSLDS